jgi:hypothetical protein
MGDNAANPGDLPTAVTDLLVMSVRIIGSTPQTATKVLEAAVNDKKFLDAVEAELKNRAQELLKASSGGGTPITGEQVQKVGEKLLSGLGDVGKTQFKEAVISAAKQTSEYQLLEAGIKRVETAFKNAPIGVWVDTNKSLIIIIGAVAAIGTGLGLYLAKAGDSITQPINGFARAIEIGTLTLTPQLTTFVPSERRVGVGIRGDWKFDRLTWSANLTGTSVPGAATGKAEGAVRYVIGQELKLHLSGSIEGTHGDPKLLDPKFKPTLSGQRLYPGTGRLALGVDYNKDGFTLAILGSVTPIAVDLTTSVGYSRMYGRTAISFEGAGVVSQRGLSSLRAGASLTSKQPFGEVGARLSTSVAPTGGWGTFLTLEIRR